MRFITRPGGRQGLDLVLLEAVLPEGSVGGDTVIAEVNQNVPSKPSQYVQSRRGAIGSNLHGIAVHVLAHEDVVVVVVSDDLLDSAGGTSLELGNAFLASAALLEGLEEFLDVA